MTAPTAVDVAGGQRRVSDASESVHLRAAQTVCRYATGPAEALELLDMLGLVEDGQLVPVPDPADGGESRGRDGHDVVLAELYAEPQSTAPAALRELSPVAAPQTPTKKAPAARPPVGTAPGPHAGPVTGRRAPGAAPQVSPSRSHQGTGGGLGAPDAPTEPPTAPPRRRTGPALQPIPHGSYNGYRAHYRRHELPVCDACNDAYRARNQAKRAQQRAETVGEQATANTAAIAVALDDWFAQAQRSPSRAVRRAAGVALGDLMALRVHMDDLARAERAAALAARTGGTT